MDNVIQYSIVYERLVFKLIKGLKLSRNEEKIHNQLCQWIAQDTINETFTYLRRYN